MQTACFPSLHSMKNNRINLMNLVQFSNVEYPKDSPVLK